jgi:hypothetical protein
MSDASAPSNAVVARAAIAVTEHEQHRRARRLGAVRRRPSKTWHEAGLVRERLVEIDGRRVVSASWDNINTLKVWGLQTGRPLATLEGHAGSDSARAARCAIRLRAAVVLMGSALWNCA